MKSPASLSLFCVLSVALLTACGGAETPATSQSAPPPPPATSAALTGEALLARGANRYKLCRACHTLEQDGRHKVGPNLYGVMGAVAGSREDFNYSKAMAASGIVWDDETLNAYLEDPRGYIPGNRMSFIGVRKAEDRAAIIAYLRAETGGQGD